VNVLLGGRAKAKAKTAPGWIRAYLLEGERPAGNRGVAASDEAAEMILAVDYAGELADVWQQWAPGLLEEWARLGRKGDPWAVRELRRQQDEREARRR
jgi:hypothetical protein